MTTAASRLLLVLQFRRRSSCGHIDGHRTSFSRRVAAVYFGLFTSVSTRRLAAPWGMSYQVERVLWHPDEILRLRPLSSRVTHDDDWGTSFSRLIRLIYLIFYTPSFCTCQTELWRFDFIFNASGGCVLALVSVMVQVRSSPLPFFLAESVRSGWALNYSLIHSRPSPHSEVYKVNFDPFSLVDRNRHHHHLLRPESNRQFGFTKHVHWRLSCQRWPCFDVSALDVRMFFFWHTVLWRRNSTRDDVV